MRPKYYITSEDAIHNQITSILNALTILENLIKDEYGLDVERKKIFNKIMTHLNPNEDE